MSRLRLGKGALTKKGTKRLGNPAQLRSPHQEKEIANAVKGRLTPRSGAGNEKGDVRLKSIARIEAKTTKRKSFSVTMELLQKLEDNAIPAGEIPIHIIEFLGEDGKPTGSVSVMPTWAVYDLLERVSKNEK